MPCCIQVRRTLRLSIRGSRTGCTGKVRQPTKARDEPTDDKKLYSHIGRPLRVDGEWLRHTDVQGAKAVRTRAEDGMERDVVSLARSYLTWRE
jgi:hypothetical protein